MTFFTTALSLALAATSVTPTSAYTLTRNSDASQFFNDFEFFTSPDPTQGFVQYVSQEEATSASMAKTVNNQIYLGVDNSSTIDASGAGRRSVRLESKETFSNGILIADFAHIPSNTCGTWPAYWTVNGEHSNEDPYGEIDIIEGYNDQTADEISIHTDGACTLGSAAQGWTTRTKECSLSASDDGCGVTGPEGSYGQGVNEGHGGVWVTSVEDRVRIWMFPRQSIPADITNGAPDPSSWGQPVFDLDLTQNGCSADSFKHHTIIFNIDFCGAYGGGDGWSKYSQCPQSTGASSCAGFVANNPGAFDESYFLINSVKLYQK